MHLFLTVMGLIMFPPLILCLMFSTGDVEGCSFGVWSNAYKEDSVKCDKKSNWRYTQLSDYDATCYYNRYKYGVLKNFSLTRLCDIKIEYDTYGKAAGRNGGTC